MEPYRVYRVPKKKKGQYRTIREPAEYLKGLQFAIKGLLDGVPVSEYAHGFVAGRSILTNALVHRQQRYVLNIDVQDFFPSVKLSNFGPVFEKLLAYDISAECLGWIAETCFWEGSLPQGASTSPVLSNLYLSRLDALMGKYARDNDIAVSRYCDDITLSGGDWLCGAKASVLDYVDALLGESHLVRNKKKTKLMPYYQRQVVTGIVVNNERLTLSRKKKEELYLSLKGTYKDLLTENEVGYLEFVRSVDPTFYQKIINVMR